MYSTFQRCRPGLPKRLEPLRRVPQVVEIDRAHRRLHHRPQPPPQVRHRRHQRHLQLQRFDRTRRRRGRRVRLRRWTRSVHVEGRLVGAIKPKPRIRIRQQRPVALEPRVLDEVVRDVETPRPDADVLEVYRPHLPRRLSGFGVPEGVDEEVTGEGVVVQRDKRGRVGYRYRTRASNTHPRRVRRRRRLQPSHLVVNVDVVEPQRVPRGSHRLHGGSPRGGCGGSKIPRLGVSKPLAEDVVRRPSGADGCRGGCRGRCRGGRRHDVERERVEPRHGARDRRRSARRRHLRRRHRPQPRERLLDPAVGEGGEARRAEAVGVERAHGAVLRGAVEEGVGSVAEHPNHHGFDPSSFSSSTPCLVVLARPGCVKRRGRQRQLVRDAPGDELRGDITDVHPLGKHPAEQREQSGLELARLGACGWGDVDD